MTPSSDPSAGPAVPSAPAPAEPRQRWRLTFSRGPVAPDAVGRVALDAWQEALAASGLPLAGLETGAPGRARIAFAAPLSAAAAGEAELVDVWLLERRAAWQVREALAGRLPPDHAWIGAEDVWLGAPALAGRIVAADWRVAVGGAGEAERERLSEAARALLSARSLPRVRLKGGAEKRYDLRPLLGDIALAEPGADHAGEEMVVRIRTRFDPEAGSGRPEEVVGALGEAAGLPLRVGAVTRERLLLADDPGGTRRR